MTLDTSFSPDDKSKSFVILSLSLSGRNKRQRHCRLTCLCPFSFSYLDGLTVHTVNVATSTPPLPSPLGHAKQSTIDFVQNIEHTVCRCVFFIAAEQSTVDPLGTMLELYYRYISRLPPPLCPHPPYNQACFQPFVDVDIIYICIPPPSPPISQYFDTRLDKKKMTTFPPFLYHPIHFF